MQSSGDSALILLSAAAPWRWEYIESDSIWCTVTGIRKRAVAAGHGEQDVAALIKVLRDNGGA